MGKQKHTKDRLFISQTEYKHEWGGKKDTQKNPIAKLPFDYCSISLLPFDTPVCSPDGSVFDLMNIIPYLKRHKRNPVTGAPLKENDLVKLHFHKNDKGEYHDPISFKVFTESTHIVAIKPSGNVFSFETIEQLNKKAKFWHDLLTDETFCAKDIITLQDPQNVDKRTVTKFNFIQNQNSIDGASKNQQKTKQDGQNDFINKNGTTQRIFVEIKKSLDEKKINQEKEDQMLQSKKVKKEYGLSTNEFIQEMTDKNSFKHKTQTQAKVSTSVTSTACDPEEKGQNQFRFLQGQELRQIYYDKIHAQQLKGYVQLVTTLGIINCELFCDMAPRACENFIELCESGYYNGVQFHRLIQGFMIQGGDKTGTKEGGTTIYQDGKAFKDEFHPKLRHNKAGIISMANSGPDTNLSYFITLGEASHLDDKHTVFGQVVGGISVLDAFNHIQTDKNDKPINKIEILETKIYSNPFREIIQQIRNQKLEDRLLIDQSSQQPIIQNELQQQLKKVTNQQSKKDIFTKIDQENKAKLIDSLLQD